jgi:RNA recognition motif-containing protein
LQSLQSLSNQSAPIQSRRPDGPTAILRVSNLPYEIGQDDLKGIFKDHNVQSADVIMDRRGKSKGFGFAKFNSIPDAQKALQDFDKALVNQREIAITFANEKVSASES